MSEPQRKILVSAALPYANGPIHIGHLVEYIQTDIWVRFQRLIGHHCIYVCASDAHGTAIMLRADSENIDPEVLVANVSESQQRDFADFLVNFDVFHSTHSTENRELVEAIFSRLDEQGFIARRTITQAYDPEQHMFLPDRYVTGTCPSCKTPDQYGDNCDNCSATYDPLDLIDPISSVSGAPPIAKESEHLFFTLPAFENALKKLLLKNADKNPLYTKLQEWFKEGLKDWDISRDAPYFGFRIPGTKDKYFYVWMDAPIGYMAAFLKYCREHDLDFDEYWKPGSDAFVYHFIGKDIIYFHSLFWPAVLMGSGYRTPSQIFAHGHLTLNKRKMSKSKGELINARTYLNHLDPEALRYYFFAKLGPGIDDLDFSPDDFVARVNADLVNKFVNIASRCAGFITRNFDGRLAGALHDRELFDEFGAAGAEIATAYEERRFAEAARTIMELADRANQYIDSHKPWKLIKDSSQQTEAHLVCSQGLNLFRTLLVYLKPVLPALAEQAEQFLNCKITDWSDCTTALLDHQINPYKPLKSRIDVKQVNAMLDEERAAAVPADGLKANAGDGNCITIDEFKKIDLRVALITKAEAVDGADKLLRLTLDTGDQTRTVFAGIKSSYAPADLTGKLTVMVANLEPRKMRFGVSEGMVLAASDGAGVFILSPDTGATPGLRVT
ncbi:MAG: methionine--tRNA ligase [Gammaproteobacteria bacterium]|nr:methionine--tRNA ligase [Gammaproteobacteria bacterium]